MPECYEVDDLFSYQRISEICGSRKTNVVACTIEQADRKKDDYRSAIWCYSTSGGPPVKLTAGTSVDNSPNWAPDGRQLAFVSEGGSGKLQVFLIDREGGERRQLTHLDGSVVSLAWSPDGARIAVTASVSIAPVSRTGARSDSAEGVPEIASRLPYKSDGLGYVLDRQIHLFLVDASTGSARQITKGLFDVRAMAWSPDGQRLAFARTRDERCAHRTDIWSIDVDGEDATQMSSHVASASFPKWSPDGRCVVFSGAGNEGDAQIRMWMIDSQEGTVRTVGDDDIDVVDGGSLTWDEDSRGISFIAGRRGLQEIGHVDLSDGRYSTIATGLRHVSALGVTANRRLAFVAESPAKPNQLYVCDSDGGSERCISSLNAWWDDRTSASVTLRGFDVPDGDGNTERVEGWVIRASANGPAGPLLVDIHGGPASHALLAFTSHPYWNVLVSHGWTILALNAVGSSGYGRSFSGRLRGRWGDIDLQQHLAAAEQLRQAGDVDGRMAVIGKSYGGYESAWAVTHGTQFRAAVIAAPITNLETHFGVSDSGYYSDPFDMGGTPLDVHDNYALLSPARYAGKARTPVLIINGKEDNRCPMAQAEDFFVKVMRFTSTPAELVLYPGADHHFYESGKPSQRADVMSRIVSWLQAWIGTPVGVDN